MKLKNIIVFLLSFTIIASILTVSFSAGMCVHVSDPNEVYESIEYVYLSDTAHRVNKYYTYLCSKCDAEVNKRLVESYIERHEILDWTGVHYHFGDKHYFEMHMECIPCQTAKTFYQSASCPGDASGNGCISFMQAVAIFFELY